MKGQTNRNPRILRGFDALVIAMLQFDLPRCALFNTV
jgi:hypothetical protein